MNDQDAWDDIFWLQQGHYCPDWDYDWITPGSPEHDCCTCWEREEIQQELLEREIEHWQEQDAAAEERNTLDDLTWMRDEIRYLEGKKP